MLEDEQSEMVNELLEQKQEISPYDQLLSNLQEALPDNELVPYISGSSSESDFVENKYKEIDAIQNDLESLVSQLSAFMNTQEKLPEAVLDIDASDEEEKVDGPSEKELQLYSGDNFYICEGDNPPEINWNVVGPIIQNTVGDLQKISNLNAKVSSMINRIRGLTKNAIDDIGEY